MTESQSHLVDEISQIQTQYLQEVPGHRRAWPESIKHRVIELHASGMKFAEIARRTGLAYYTVLRWRDEKSTPGFQAVNVVAKRRSATVTVADSGKEMGTVTVAESVRVVLASGVRIEGLSLSGLREILPALGVVS